MYSRKSSIRSKAHRGGAFNPIEMGLNMMTNPMGALGSLFGMGRKKRGHGVTHPQQNYYGSGVIHPQLNYYGSGMSGGAIPLGGGMSGGMSHGMGMSGGMSHGMGMSGGMRHGAGMSGGNAFLDFFNPLKSPLSPISWFSGKGQVGGKRKRAPSARGQKIAHLMRTQNMTLGQASKHLKQMGH